MPRNEIKYENTVIYKIQHNENDDLLYVGHTTDFTKRKYQHRQCATSSPTHRAYGLKLYTMIRENGGWDSFKMLEIKKYPCNDKREAEAEEDKTMKEMKASMNSRGSLLDKVKARETRLKYIDENREAISLKEREYRENHKEQYANHCKRYYAEHKEEIMKTRNEIVQCECGHYMRKCERGKSRHQQSQKHIDGLKMFTPLIHEPSK